MARSHNAQAAQAWTLRAQSLNEATARSHFIVPSDDAQRGTAQWLKASYAECTRDGPISTPLSPSAAQPRHRRRIPDEPARPSTAALSAHDGRLLRTAAAKWGPAPSPLRRRCARSTASASAHLMAMIGANKSPRAMIGNKAGTLV